MWRGSPPLARGKAEYQITESEGMGSPPLARGKVAHEMGCTDRTGITPACAGKSPVWHAEAASLRDHPRLRGEKPFQLWHAQNFLGSPPLARGKAKGAKIALSGSRITPACAGKSGCIVPSTAFIKDHPRLRGEKYSLELLSFVLEGSPPLARGKETLRASVHRLKRDHPRLRGEKDDFGGEQMRRPGSPPLARGKAKKPPL